MFFGLLFISSMMHVFAQDTIHLYPYIENIKTVEVFIEGEKYDFLFDNCTTRLRDLVERASKGQVHYGEVLKTEKTFRNLIYEYLQLQLYQVFLIEN